ncbi:MAG: hypothetical protein JWN86_4388 [Planctomycetota bacterium]|nr:hypothetical protein [Planctomycetota bacterium]
MVDQATVNSSANRGASVPANAPLTAGVFGNLAELGSDIANLAELQVKLTAVDLQTSLRRAVVPATMLATGLVVLLAALPIALIGASELLADVLVLAHRGWAYVIVAGIALVLTIVLALISLPRLRRSFDNLVNSKEELERNVAWIKTVLAYSGRLPSQRRR